MHLNRWISFFYQKMCSVNPFDSCETESSPRDNGDRWNSAKISALGGKSIGKTIVIKTEMLDREEDHIVGSRLSGGDSSSEKIGETLRGAGEARRRLYISHAT